MSGEAYTEFAIASDKKMLRRKKIGLLISSGTLICTIVGMTVPDVGADIMDLMVLISIIAFAVSGEFKNIFTVAKNIAIACIALPVIPINFLVALCIFFLIPVWALLIPYIVIFISYRKVKLSIADC